MIKTINKQALREAAQQCSAQEPLRIVEYHGKMCLRNSGGIVFTVLRDSSFPEYSSENENYARLADLTNPVTVLALLDELEAAEKRIAELESRELVVNLPAYVDGRTLGYGEVNHMIDLCADAIEKAGHAAGIITKVGE